GVVDPLADAGAAGVRLVHVEIRESRPGDEEARGAPGPAHAVLRLAQVPLHLSDDLLALGYVELGLRLVQESIYLGVAGAVALAGDVVAVPPGALLAVVVVDQLAGGFGSCSLRPELVAQAFELAEDVPVLELEDLGVVDGVVAGLDAQLADHAFDGLV